MSASPPRVLMIAPYCFPPVNAEAIVNCKLALAMLQVGWSLESSRSRCRLCASILAMAASGIPCPP